MDSQEELTLLYCTTPNEETAFLIGKALVTNRLVACVNVLGAIRSFYHWNDTLFDEAEVAFVAKTTMQKSSEAISFIKQMHPYECPCIVLAPLIGGYSEFLQWIKSSTVDEAKKQGNH